MVGASSDLGLAPQPVNLETGLVDPGGEIIRPEHVLQTLFRHAGLGDEPDMRVEGIQAIDALTTLAFFFHVSVGDACVKVFRAKGFVAQLFVKRNCLGLCAQYHRRPAGFPRECLEPLHECASHARTPPLLQYGHALCFARLLLVKPKTCGAHRHGFLFLRLRPGDKMRAGFCAVIEFVPFLVRGDVLTFHKNFLSNGEADFFLRFIFNQRNPDFWRMNLQNDSVEKSPWEH